MEEEKTSLKAEEWTLQQVLAETMDNAIHNASEKQVHKIITIINHMKPLNTQNQFWLDHEMPQDIEDFDAKIETAADDLMEFQLWARDLPGPIEDDLYLENILEGMYNSIESVGNVVSERVREVDPKLYESYQIEETRKDKEYHWKECYLIDFQEKGENKLVTESNRKEIVESIVEVADSKGWETIKVTGKEAFKQQVWMEASARGMNVKGYKPTEQDLYELEKRKSKQNTAERSTENTVENGTERQVSGQSAYRDKEAVKVRKEELSQAYNTLSEKEAIRRYPELEDLYKLEGAATELANRRIGIPESRENYVNAIRERSLKELAQGNALPQIAQKAKSKQVEKEAVR